MKVLILIATLLPSLVVAQNAVPPRAMARPPQIDASSNQSDVLPDNYELTLTIADKDVPPLQVSVVIASSRFAVGLGEQHLNFSGTITVDEGAGIRVAYTLGWDSPLTTNGSTSYVVSSTQGSVRLKLGDDVQIIKAGNRTARLSIKKLEAAAPK